MPDRNCNDEKPDMCFFLIEFESDKINMLETLCRRTHVYYFVGNAMLSCILMVSYHSSPTKVLS